MFAGFYQGRRVLVTGHTGFKGAWLSLWLQHLGADVHGLALAPPTEPGLHELTEPGTFASQTDCDVRDLAAVETVLESVQPEFIFHLAAQSLVRQSYNDPMGTLSTNVFGTAHVLESARRLSLGCPVVVVTSDKCYENSGGDHFFEESDAMGGADVYSASKAAAEMVSHSWRRSFFERDGNLGPVATARAGNVIGGGDYAADRIVPDAVRALIAGEAVPVRNPTAVRPWQHVIDCLSGYLWLGMRMNGKDVGSKYNFGPNPESQQPVQQLVEELLKHWPGDWCNLAENNPLPEAPRLSLAIDKAARELNWQPVWNWETAVEQATAWYRARHVEDTTDLRAYSLAQIDRYGHDAAEIGQPWAA